MNVGYLTYRGLNVSAGISHQRSNLAAMIREAVLSERTLMVPPFRLSGRHNNGRELVTQLDEYFDMTSVTANGMPIRLINTPAGIPIEEGVVIRPDDSVFSRSETLIIKSMSGVSLVREPLQTIYPGFQGIEVQIPLHPRLEEIAGRIALLLPPHAAWIHARRGDKLPFTRRATSAANIHRVVQRVAPETQMLYIATDERQLSVFDPLAKHYVVTSHQSIPELESLAHEDNYKLFLIEQEYGAYFPIRISTFRVPGDEFQGSLCEYPGWQ